MLLFYTKDKANCSRELIKNIKDKVLINRFKLLVDPKRLNVVLNTIQDRYADKNFKIMEICLFALENSIILEDDDSYSIIVNPTLRWRGYKVDTVIKFINDGDLESQPYPVFTLLFNLLLSELPSLLRLNFIGAII